MYIPFQTEFIDWHQVCPVAVKWSWRIKVNILNTNPQHNITPYKQTTYFLECMEVYKGNKQTNKIWYLLQYVFNRLFQNPQSFQGYWFAKPEVASSLLVFIAG